MTAPDQRQRFSALPTSRVEASSDGVFAIAVTIIVLSLVDPRHESGQLFPALVAHWPDYVAYTAAFIYVGVIWLNHHQAFARIRYANRPLLALNLGVLFTTSLIAFPTAVVSDALREDLSGADARTAVALYALITAAMCASWVLLYAYLIRRPDLLADGVEPNYTRHGVWRSVAGIGLYLIAGLLGFFVYPLIALVVFPILPVFYFLTSEGLGFADAPTD